MQKFCTGSPNATAPVACAPQQLGQSNSDTPAANGAARTAWLAAVGIAAPEYLVDFESGFVDGQNVSGVGGLFPGELVINGSGGQATIETGAGSSGGSNPVLTVALEHNDSPRISKIQFDATGDGQWAVDNLEYGRVPEPATLALVGIGLFGTGMARRRRAPATSSGE
jgi:hypothetical protein